MGRDINIDVEFVGGKSLVVVLDKYPTRITKAIRDVIKSYSHKIKTDTQRDMRHGTKTGRFYTYNGRRYQASAPGETPAVRSGRLVNSINVDIRRNGLEGVIGTEVVYSKYLIAMDRPIFAPSLDKFSQPFINGIKAAISNIK